MTTYLVEIVWCFVSVFCLIMVGCLLAAGWARILVNYKKNGKGFKS